MNEIKEVGFGDWVDMEVELYDRWRHRAALEVFEFGDYRVGVDKTLGIDSEEVLSKLGNLRLLEFSSDKKMRMGGKWPIHRTEMGSRLTTNGSTGLGRKIEVGYREKVYIPEGSAFSGWSDCDKRISRASLSCEEQFHLGIRAQRVSLLVPELVVARPIAFIENDKKKGEDLEQGDPTNNWLVIEKLPVNVISPEIEEYDPIFHPVDAFVQLKDFFFLLGIDTARLGGLKRLRDGRVGAMNLSLWHEIGKECVATEWIDSTRGEKLQEIVDKDLLHFGDYSEIVRMLFP